MNLDNNHLKKNPFTVPDHYFDDFSKKIMDKVEKEGSMVENRKKGKTIRLRYSITAAASIIILFGLSILFWGHPGNTQLMNKELASENSIEDYLLLVDDYSIFEAIENDTEEIAEEDLNISTMEEVLIASISEYELLVN